MGVQDRFVSVLLRVPALLPDNLRNDFAAMVSKQSLALMGGIFAAWAASHALGIGFFADAGLVVVGVGMLGWQGWQAIGELKDGVSFTICAQTEADLDRAAHAIARCISMVGVAVFMVLLMKGAQRAAPAVRTALAGRVANLLGGMASKHFECFRSVAQNMKTLIVVRFTNPLSTRLIELGCPAKPFGLKMHTSSTSGIVTATTEAEILAAKNAGYFVVEEGSMLRTGKGTWVRAKTESVPDWTPARGEVVDPVSLLPVVGDYDLLAVVNPKSTGQTMALAASNGVTKAEWTNPIVTKVKDALNARMGETRVMHGPQDLNPKGLRNFMDLKPGEGALLFFPDGTTMTVNSLAEINEVMAALGRQSIKGSYGPAPTGLPSIAGQSAPLSTPGPPNLRLIKGGLQ
jgi:hypothetical protein